MMIVAVGSLNPTKITPVQEVFGHHFKKVKVVPVGVESGVADQPMDHDVMYTGAYNRAKSALKMVKGAHYGVGIEGGLHKYSFGWLEDTIVVIINKKGEVGIGKSGGVMQPKEIISKIKKGKNLNEAIKELYGIEDLGSGIGMYGWFTDKVVTRSSAIKHGVAFALSRFLHKNLY